MTTTTLTSGVHEIKRYNKSKLSVAVEREGKMHTLMYFEVEERALADQIYQEALHTHVDDFAALVEKYSALRAGMSSAPPQAPKPAAPATDAPADKLSRTKEVKGLIDEAEKIGRGLKQLREQAANATALVNKAETAHDKAWAKVTDAIEALKNG